VRVAVLGAGAMGGIFGGALADGADTLLVGASAEVVAAAEAHFVAAPMHSVTHPCTA
jgi:ketopantoate reductase